MPADILDDFESKLKKINKNDEIQIDCTGGGRILHEAAKKEILVYGYSMVNEISLRIFNMIFYIYILNQ